jgi:hypothetical protein
MAVRVEKSNLAVTPVPGFSLPFVPFSGLAFRRARVSVITAQ